VTAPTTTAIFANVPSSTDRTNIKGDFDNLVTHIATAVTNGTFNQTVANQLQDFALEQCAALFAKNMGG
jgi:hypothetical protein